MEKFEELDFTDLPIRLELGLGLVDVVANEKSEKKFRKGVESIRKKIKDSNGIDLPMVNITDNPQIPKNSYKLIIYGKEVASCLISKTEYKSDALLFDLEVNISSYLYLFKDDFKISMVNLEKKMREQSREAYLFLFRYYTNIVPDKKQAFHWLKKMTYYDVPEDIRQLACFYRDGKGCEKDQNLSNKLYDKISDFHHRQGRF